MNAKIQQMMKTRIQTRARHVSQSCKVFTIKINKSKLNKQQKKHLRMLFYEAKWLYNDMLNYMSNDNELTNYTTTIKEVQVKTPEQYENRKLEHISSQMKQGIRDTMFCSMISLKQLKKNGRKIGKLKFTSQYNSILLKQYNNTYKIKNNRIKLQGLRKTIYVNGLKQIPKNCEIANAHIIQKCGDYYFQITTYSKKQKKNIPNKVVGIDFGCETQLTLSDGTKIKYLIPISKRVKKLDRKIMKKKRKRSNNKYKDQIKRQKAYNKITNIKKDVRNKIVSTLVNNYKTVIVQNESIHAWHTGGHGKKIQHTSIGGIIRDLKNKSHTSIVVDKFFPSTKLCPKCSKKNKLPRWQRVYYCECGYEEDRDVKAAVCIRDEGLKTLQIPTGRREFTPGEIGTSVSTVINVLSNINYLLVSSGRRARKPHT